MQRQLTKKLFFRKYPFKIDLKCDGASFIKRRGIEATIDACNSKESITSTRYYWSNSSTSVDKVELQKFAYAIKPFYEQGLKCRVEGKLYSFFVEDRETFEKLEKDLRKWVKNSWAPASDIELAFLTGNNRKVIVDQYPYGHFTYKIVFKTNWTSELGTKFIQWLAKYPVDSYKISPSTKKYLLGKSRYCQDPFMYILDPKMLTMLTLFAGSHIKYTEEFVLRYTLLL